MGLLIFTLLLLSQAVAVKADNRKPKALDSCSEHPVIMLIDGVTHNQERMKLYAKALAESGLHQRAGSAYLNNPRHTRILEGSADHNHVSLMIDFPSECAALDFWNSSTYQREIKPLRQGAGDYRIELFRRVRP